VRILVVHQYYLFPGQPGGSRFNELARLWSASGHQVTVIAGTVNYSTGEIPAEYRRRWMVTEQDGAVRVIRCHVPASYGKSYAGRMWAFFGFTLSAATAALRAPGADVVVATSPPLVAALPGWLAARLRRAKLVFEIRDLWPESAVTTGVLRSDSMLTKVLYGLERWACKTADAINVLTPAFRDDLVRRGLASEQDIVFVPNGADVEAFSPGPRDNAFRREHGWKDRFVVLYAGAHGRANALDQLIDTAVKLKARQDILIASVGDGGDRMRLMEKTQALGLANLQFLGPVAKERMPEVVRACDAGAAVLQNNPTFRTVYPNKVFDYMACEKPTVLAIDGVARTLVCDEAKAGLFAPPEDSSALAAVITRLADDQPLCKTLGASGRAWVLANATREALADRYLDIFQRLVAA
jgi:glycosyltransferase involved in cell wall biosynthesis